MLSYLCRFYFFLPPGHSSKNVKGHPEQGGDPRFISAVGGNASRSLLQSGVDCGLVPPKASAMWERGPSVLSFFGVLRKYGEFYQRLFLLQLRGFCGFFFILEKITIRR